MPTQAQLIAVLELLTRRANPPHRPAQRLDLPAAARLPDGLCGAWLRGLPLRAGLQTAHCDLRGTPLAATLPSPARLSPPQSAGWPGSAAGATGMALSADGRLLAVAHHDALWLWALQDDGDPLPLARLGAGDAGLCALAFAPDGQQIAVGDFRGQIRLLGLRAEGGLFVQARLEGHGDAVNALTYSSDGRFLFSAGNDMTLRSWRLLSPASAHDAATPQLTLGVPRSILLDVAGKRLLVGSKHGPLQAWSLLEDGSLVPEPISAPLPKVALAISVQGLIYAVDGSGQLQWLSADLVPLGAQTLSDAQGAALLALAKQLLAVGGSDGRLQLVELHQDGSAGRSQALSAGTAELCALAFSADERLLLALDAAGLLWRWALQADGSVHALPVWRRAVGWLAALACSPAGDQLVVGGDEPWLRRWRPGEPPREQPGPALDEALTALAWHPRGLWCASGGVGGGVQIHGGPLLTELLGRYPSAGGPVQALAISPYGGLLAAAQGFSGLRLWAIDESGLLREVSARPVAGHTQALAFDADDRWLVSAHAGVNAEQGLRVWERRGADLHEQPQGMMSMAAAPLCLAFASSGPWLLCGDAAGGLSLWNLVAAEGPQQRVLPRSGSSAPVLALAFHPAGRLFALADQNGDIELWAFEAGVARFAQRWTAHEGAVGRLLFLPDGVLASIGSDGVLALSAPGRDVSWQVSWRLIGGGLVLQEEPGYWLLRRSDGQAFESRTDNTGRRRLCDAVAHAWLRFGGQAADGSWHSLAAYELPIEQLEAISWLDEGRQLRVRRL